MDKLTNRQAAIVGAFTGIMSGPFEDLHKYIEEVLGRPVFTHEMADEGVVAEIKDAARDDFLLICAEGAHHAD